ncbi:MAG: hypothetical protein H7Z74_05140 [Anaerolineae bacterium]|nr:hypothetical protein [Gemmatimonadaceae bacterium]
MPKITRVSVVHGALLLFAVVLIARAAYVQLWQGRDWAAHAQRQQLSNAKLPAPRGTIYDLSGERLARSREMVTVSIAPREVKEPARVSRELAKLRLDRKLIARSLDGKRAWVILPGRHLAGDIGALLALRGVHRAPVIERMYPPWQSSRRIVGHVDHEGNAVDGLERALDDLLRGQPGISTEVRDARGRRLPSPGVPGVAPVAGSDVVLTISQALQEIADRALQDAIAKMGAEGGDIVVLDPYTGEIRALATYRSGRSSGSPAISEPFEPGSTLKPFIAAALLSRKLATPDDTMDVENGVLTLEGRTIRDVHKASSMTLREVIAQSSNVGIVKFAQRLTIREQYETLRDVGFGTPTGVPYPSEAPGVLFTPASWSRQSRASLAMGYEVSVTPLQLALAYATIANGGELLEPALVKEIRSPNGVVTFRNRRRLVRRVMPREVASTLRGMLRETVADGTASDAGIGTFDVAGKTGTAWRTVKGRYAPNQYTASFVGIFPAENPQYVVLVKIDNPAGVYYGGKTAAPVSKVVIEAAMAARDAALDRSALMAGRNSSLVAREQKLVESAEGSLWLDRRVAASPATAVPTAESSKTGAGPASANGHSSAPFVFTLPVAQTPLPLQARPRAIPEVAGLPVREAARRLHSAGFRVRLVGTGIVTGTLPASGVTAAVGSLVKLSAAPAP